MAFDVADKISYIDLLVTHSSGAFNATRGYMDVELLVNATSTQQINGWLAGRSTQPQDLPTWYTLPVIVLLENQVRRIRTLGERFFRLDFHFRDKGATGERSVWVRAEGY